MMENSPANSDNSTRVSQTTSLVQTKSNLVAIVLAVLISSVVFSIGGYYFGSRTLKLQEAPLGVSSPSPVLIDKKNELIPMQLPFPVVRKGAKASYTDWKLYKDKSGYSFYYPKNWFVSEGGNQIQSWDPNNSDRPLPLSDDQTKWDLYFGEKTLSSFGEAIFQADSSIDKWDMVEVSSTIKGWPVYFAFKEVVEPMASSYLVAVIVTPENKILTLHGFSGDAKSPNSEILKQIVESIQK